MSVIFKFIFLLLLSSSTFAQGLKDNECSNKTFSGKYQHHYQVDEFLIAYDLTGPDAIENPVDNNNNAIPDIVEDTIFQLTTMRDALENLGFEHPFEKFRYQRSGVAQIQVRMHDINGNGLAYDPPHRDMSHEHAPCVLLISLSNNLKTGNLTPAHELFHLYQYSSTIFKNRWYLEGMARWAENLLGARNYDRGIFPESREEKDALFDQSYDAIRFWMTFADAVSPTTIGQRNYPNELLERRYINGAPIIHDEATTHGAAAIIETLDSLGDLDDQISVANGWQPKRWESEEDDQRRAEANNLPMFNTIFNLYRENTSL